MITLLFYNFGIKFRIRLRITVFFFTMSEETMKKIETNNYVSYLKNYYYEKLHASYKWLYKRNQVTIGFPSSSIDGMEKSHRSVGIVHTSFQPVFSPAHPLHQTAARPSPDNAA